MASSAYLSTRAVTDAVLDRLRTLPHGNGLGPEVTVYDAAVPDDVPVIADAGGRVAPYVVLYPGSTYDTAAGRDLADTNADAVWSATLTVAAGYRQDAEETRDRVHAWLRRWAPAADGDLDGLSVSTLHPPLGFQPTRIRSDDDVQPPRFFGVLEYRATLTR